MKMQKRQFRIGQLADLLGVERFVVRFWEKEFKLGPTRSNGGQRFYEEKDLNTFQAIKKLLYEEGFTIAGAKKKLKETNTQILGSHRTTFEQESTDQYDHKSFLIGLLALKQSLIKLKNQL
jgi:DNA-binding transcriptional MerR regulator